MYFVQLFLTGCREVYGGWWWFDFKDNIYRKKKQWATNFDLKYFNNLYSFNAAKQP